MITKTISALVIVATSITAFSAQETTRRCTYTGISAKCGEAKTVVECEGFDEAHYLSDDEKISNVSLNLHVGNDSLERDVVEDLAVIKEPTATVRDYNTALNTHDQKLLDNKELKNVSPLHENAIKDLKEALTHKDSKVKVNSGKDNLAIGTFEISRSAKLYKSCFKAKGEAAPSKAADKKS